MNHSDKLKRMEEHLAAIGVGKSTFAPPVYRLLWQFGLEVPPPLFAGFASLALLQGGFFGVVWGAMMWFGFWSRRSPPMPGWIAVSAALLAGVLFGLCMAAYFRYKAKQLGLPAWEHYSGRGDA